MPPISFTSRTLDRAEGARWAVTQDVPGEHEAGGVFITAGRSRARTIERALRSAENERDFPMTVWRKLHYSDSYVRVLLIKPGDIWRPHWM